MSSSEEEFITFFKQEKYAKIIRDAFEIGKDSFVLDFHDLEKFNSRLANRIIDIPDAHLLNLKESARKSVEEGRDISVNIQNLFSFTKLRDLGSKEINRLVQVRGVIVSLNEGIPWITEPWYRCRRCNFEFPFVQSAGQYLVSPYKCDKCKKGKSFELIEWKSKFEDVQFIYIQEVPEDLPAGQMPQGVQVILNNHFVNLARIGDIATIVGIMRVKPMSASSKFKGFTSYMECCGLKTETAKDPSEIELSNADIEEIKKWSRDIYIYEIIRDSIAPSIYGCEYIKEALMYMLFGGVREIRRDVIRRGDIHVLLLGDPSTAKTQLELALKNVAPRAIFTGGQGSTAAGLTATAIRTEDGRFTLEAGALVLGDKGIVCIDEVEKMRETDRQMIHIAMEQGIVPINKGGKNVNLNARAAILAAGNPPEGRYNPYKGVADNIGLDPALLSRFDLIFIVRDIPDEGKDIAMAEHILRGSKNKSVMPVELLKKYVCYAKRFFPKLTEEAESHLRNVYCEMRRTPSADDLMPIRITPRSLESLIRISEAHAKIKLKDTVDVEDAIAAVEIMKVFWESINYDTTQIENAKTFSERIKRGLKVLREISVGNSGASKEQWVRKLREANESDPEKIITKLQSDGMVMEPKAGFFVPV